MNKHSPFFFVCLFVLLLARIHNLVIPLLLSSPSPLRVSSEAYVCMYLCMLSVHTAAAVTTNNNAEKAREG